MRLEGSLDAFSLPDIFSLLSMTKKTGGLHLRRADAHGVVWLGDGLITGGASSLGRQSLGRRLAGTGQIADDHLAAAVDAVMNNSELGIARALRDSGAIDEGELHTVVFEHVVDTVFDLMRWPDGVFEFVVDEGNIDEVGVKREVDEVVAEARRRLEVWAAIDERVVNPETVLSLAVELADDLVLARNEWELLSLVDGRRRAGDFVNLLGRGEYAVVVALAELVGRGLVRTEASEAIAAMARRQELIASLETDAPVKPAVIETATADLVAETIVEPAAEPVAAEPDNVVAELAAAVVTDEPLVETIEDHDMTANATVEETVEDVEIEDADDDENEHVAAVSELHQRDLSAVTPQRPEPFMPSREPDHPEPLVAAMAGGGVMTAPAAAIERDPSVNKSLLLRLIAGVRGL